MFFYLPINCDSPSSFPCVPFYSLLSSLISLAVSLSFFLSLLSSLIPHLSTSLSLSLFLILPLSSLLVFAHTSSLFHFSILLIIFILICLELDVELFYLYHFYEVLLIFHVYFNSFCALLIHISAFP